MADTLSQLSLLVSRSNFALVIFVREELVEEESSSSEGNHSDNRRNNCIKLNKIPGLVPYIENHIVHDSLCEDEYSCDFEHLLSRSSLCKDGEEHDEHPHGTRIESIDEPEKHREHK